MPIINPYAKKKAPPSTTSQMSQHTSPPKPPSRSVVTPSSKARSPPAVKRKKVSFKAQLKQQLQDLKRKKKLEAERKLMEERLKERKAERRRIELEQTRIRLDNEKRREEDRKRKEAERQVEAEKRRKRDEERAMARKAAEEQQQQLAKEKLRQQIELQNEFQDRQRLLLFQQGQMLHYGFIPNNFHSPSVPSYSTGIPTTPSLFPVPYANVQPPSTASTVPIAALELSMSTPPVPMGQPQSNVQAATASLPLQNALFHNPMPVPQVSAVSPYLVNSFAGGGNANNRWRMSNVPQVRRPPQPKILSENPLHASSPFSDEYEILPYAIIIVKESGKDSSFGVSVELKTQSVLLDRDVLESLMKKRNNEVANAGIPSSETTTKVKQEVQESEVNVVVLNTNEQRLSIANAGEAGTLDPLILQPAKPQSVTLVESFPELERPAEPQPAAIVESISKSKESAETQPATLVESFPESVEPAEPQPSTLDESFPKSVEPARPQPASLVESFPESEEPAEPQPATLVESFPKSTVAPSGDEKHGVEGTSTPLISQQEVTLRMASVGPVAEKAMGPSIDETQGYGNTRHSSQENVQVEEVTTQSDSGLDPAPSQADFSVHTETADGKAVKRKRRKRAFFHAMSVMDASKQNAKTPDTDKEKKLRQGDLILEINGVRTCGLPFFTACQLFASCNVSGTCKTEAGAENEDAAKLIECSLLLARRKPPLPKPPTPVQTTSSIEQRVSAPVASNTKSSADAVSDVARDFSSDEMKALASLVAGVSGHPGRLLGYGPSEQVWRQSVTSSSALAARDLSSIQRKLHDMQSSLDAVAASAYDAFWKKEWESQHVDLTMPARLENKYMTLSQLSSIRALPRLPRGCRCGGFDHSYVNSPKCILYHALRKWSGKTPPDFAQKKIALDTSFRDLSAMETAFKDRFVKMKEDQENEIAEAKFVDEMEKLQTQKQKRAVFAPNFTTMVLCAVASIGYTFKQPVEPSLQPTDVNEASADSVDGDKDVDDLPLLALGKRPASDEVAGSPSKKIRNGTEPLSLGYHPAFLAQLLIFLSRTWGHIYREPTHDEFSWRWEIHHGQTSETHLKRDTCKNPRTPGSLTFENVEFGVASTSFGNAERHANGQESAT